MADNGVMGDEKILGLKPRSWVFIVVGIATLKIIRDSLYAGASIASSTEDPTAAASSSNACHEFADNYAKEKQSRRRWQQFRAAQRYAKDYQDGLEMCKS